MITSASTKAETSLRVSIDKVYQTCQDSTRNTGSAVGKSSLRAPSYFFARKARLASQAQVICMLPLPWKHKACGDVPPQEGSLFSLTRGDLTTRRKPAPRQAERRTAPALSPSPDRRPSNERSGPDRSSRPRLSVSSAPRSCASIESLISSRLTPPGATGPARPP